ncbi:hypothetical protein ACIQ7Q_08000 [Streptomyces sp. NPDC096176]|uniref:hypothetical protein n=1 Tax=Streptomyces sp. NPDC096176 TaxID=3366079 RepID=UPI0038139007
MAVSIFAVVLLGLLVFILVRKSDLHVAHAVVCGLLGFFLASSGTAPGIRTGVQNAVHLIGKITF